MDRRAVVALVVVLHDHLPVRPHLVVVPGPGAQLRDAVGLDQTGQRTEVVRQRRGTTGGVDEHPTLPDLHRYLDQTVPVRLEPGHRPHRGRGGQRAVEAIGPAVVRADDAAPGRRTPVGKQLVPAVPAHVREGPHPRPVDRDEYPDVARGDRPLGHLRFRPAPHAGPPAGEQVPAFPRQYRRRGVRGGGQHPRPPEREQRLGQFEVLEGQVHPDILTHPGRRSSSRWRKANTARPKKPLTTINQLRTYVFTCIRISPSRPRLGKAMERPWLDDFAWCPW
jgi:hypothetical protein